MVTAIEALNRLRDGNLRFVSNVRSESRLDTQTLRAQLVMGQNPYAVILGCSDSRSPAEIVFDQGLGDLFVIRVGGNIIAPSLVGSVEFAAEKLGTRLVVVMGHSNCGVISATVEDVLSARHSTQSSNIMSLVARVRPAVEPLADTNLAHDRAAMMKAATRANVRMSCNQLRHGSDLLERLEQHSGLLIVGAEYDIATGVVDFFDGVP